MSEQTVLLGTPVNVTVFQVHYEYKKPPRTEKLPRSASKENDVVVNQIVLTTGDASGRDIFDIAKRMVLGPDPYDGNDFRILQFHRVVDAMGLATVTSWEKLDGKATEVPGVLAKNEDDEEDDGGEQSPPGSELN